MPPSSEQIHSAAVQAPKLTQGTEAQVFFKAQRVESQGTATKFEFKILIDVKGLLPEEEQLF